MKLTIDQTDALYVTIHEALIDLRLELKLPAEQDMKLAQVEHKIWRKQKAILGVRP